MQLSMWQMHSTQFTTGGRIKGSWTSHDRDSNTHSLSCPRGYVHSMWTLLFSITSSVGNWIFLTFHRILCWSTLSDNMLVRPSNQDVPVSPVSPREGVLESCPIGEVFSDTSAWDYSRISLLWLRASCHKLASHFSLHVMPARKGHSAFWLSLDCGRFTIYGNTAFVHLSDVKGWLPQQHTKMRMWVQVAYLKRDPQEVR